MHGVYNLHRSAIDRIADILLWLKGDRRGSGHMELYMIVSVLCRSKRIFQIGALFAVFKVGGSRERFQRGAQAAIRLEQRKAAAGNIPLGSVVLCFYGNATVSFTKVPLG